MVTENTLVQLALDNLWLTLSIGVIAVIALREREAVAGALWGRRGGIVTAAGVLVGAVVGAGRRVLGLCWRLLGAAWALVAALGRRLTGGSTRVSRPSVPRPSLPGGGGVLRRALGTAGGWLRRLVWGALGAVPGVARRTAGGASTAAGATRRGIGGLGVDARAAVEWGAIIASGFAVGWFVGPAVVQWLGGLPV